ncbi:TonB-dependent receptor [Phenylobacterium kunshanense]|uniref:TonB-dependent receptor n=1 Tax=Phenylobacterium kunshanense TaxID=1445034 RepID=A0A328BRF8_9CAUL|nr:TonB-dependent receptor [Phenylobacterium kunshanense]RAK67658.1 TonB-dependent receptor [Phenylobacterium kunshanense]
MKLRLLASGAALALGAFPMTALADEAADPLVDVIVVTAPRGPAVTTTSERLEPTALAGPDPTALLARVPGGARIGNGALSGQAQYRGLFGHRLNLRVDGQRFASGGPNLMDPPFHYAPTALVAALEVDRGVSPVRAGPGLAGGMNAVFKRLDFADGPEARLGYDLSAEARSADDSYSAGGVAGLATESWRVNLLGSYEKGEDAEFPGGTIRGSRYERSVYGISAGLRAGPHELALDLRHQHTDPTGNPPFPMDIRYFSTDFARLGYRAELGGIGLEAAFSYADVGHGMNNFDLRPSPTAMNRRESLAEAVTRAAEVAATAPLAGGKLRVGLDAEDLDRNVVITNPANPAFLVTSLPDVETRRAGAHAEWTGPVGALHGEFGMRIDRHEAEAGRAVLGPALAAGPVALAAAFNAADRSREDTTVDAVARLWTAPRKGLAWRLTLARKTRVAGYVERYGWLPTNTSGGLADGNIYVGDMNLEPEVAWIAEVGFDYAGRRAYLRPTVFVREVDNYIQGAPFDATPGVADTLQERVAAMSGDPTPLRFANVDARLYGFDVAGGVKLSAAWRIDAVASYVRGERRDVPDDLYRISPPSLTAALTYDADRWSVTAETRLVADQSKVSRTNSERRTGGYGLLALYGDWKVREGVRVSAGVENLLDRRYSDHLAGYNQIDGSDVPLGARLPGIGRSAFVRVSLAR